MSQENVDLAKKILDAFNRRDKAAWQALMDPDLEVAPPQDWPEAGLIRGSEAAWHFYVQNIEAFREGVLEHVELIDAGTDRVLSHLGGEMHGALSGALVPFSYWVVSTVRDGKGVRDEWFANRAAALKAVGLEE